MKKFAIVAAALGLAGALWVVQSDTESPETVVNVAKDDLDDAGDQRVALPTTREEPVLAEEELIDYDKGAAFKELVDKLPHGVPLAERERIINEIIQKTGANHPERDREERKAFLFEEQKLHAKALQEFIAAANLDNDQKGKLLELLADVHEVWKESWSSYTRGEGPPPDEVVTKILRKDLQEFLTPEQYQMLKDIVSNPSRFSGIDPAVVSRNEKGEIVVWDGTSSSIWRDGGS